MYIDYTKWCIFEGMQTLKEYLSGLCVSDREQFAHRCGTTYGHLRNVAYGQKPAGEKLCILIERESARGVLCESLRPDVPWSVLRHSPNVVEEAVHG